MRLLAEFEREAAELAKQRDRVIQLGQLGICADCQRIAVRECPDGFCRCEQHTLSFALSIMDAVKDRNRFVHRLSPAAKKARAKRRKARKAGR